MKVDEKAQEFGKYVLTFPELRQELLDKIDNTIVEILINGKATFSLGSGASVTIDYTRGM